MTMILVEFFHHYVAYLNSPLGFAAVFLGAPFLYILLTEWRKRLALNRIPEPEFPGCIRYGLCQSSFLDARHDGSEVQSAAPSSQGSNEEPRKPRVKALFVHPIKSCKGIEVPYARVERTGLKYDRLFTFAEDVSDSTAPSSSAPKSESSENDGHQWKFITQREYPKLALLETELWINNNVQLTEAADPLNDWRAQGGCLVVRVPGSSSAEKTSLKLPLYPTTKRASANKYRCEQVSVWRDCPRAINMTSEIPREVLERLQGFLGVKRPLALFRIDEDSYRTITRSLPRDQADGQTYEVGFADAFPVHLMNLASVVVLSGGVPGLSNQALDVRRFRANIIVDGAEEYTEDSWKRLTVGRAMGTDRQPIPAQYHAACRTARCPMVNVKPDTGAMDRREPMKTLRQERVVDEGAKPHPVLGLSMIPLFTVSDIRIGDELEVIEYGEHYYEKMFA